MVVFANLFLVYGFWVILTVGSGKPLVKPNSPKGIGAWPRWPRRRLIFVWQSLLRGNSFVLASGILGKTGLLSNGSVHGDRNWIGRSGERAGAGSSPTAEAITAIWRRGD